MKSNWINDLRVQLEAIEAELRMTVQSADVATEVQRHLYVAEQGMGVALDAMRKAINLS